MQFARVADPHKAAMPDGLYQIVLKPAVGRKVDVQAAGSAGFLNKPADAQQMLDVVARAVERGDSWS